MASPVVLDLRKGGIVAPEARRLRGRKGELLFHWAVEIVLLALGNFGTG